MSCIERGSSEPTAVQGLFSGGDPAANALLETVLLGTAGSLVCRASLFPGHSYTGGGPAQTADLRSSVVDCPEPIARRWACTAARRLPIVLIE
jgi:hypothetical protein